MTQIHIYFTPDTDMIWILANFREGEVAVFSAKRWDRRNRVRDPLSLRSNDGVLPGFEPTPPDCSDCSGLHHCATTHFNVMQILPSRNVSVLMFHNAVMLLRVSWKQAHNAQVDHAAKIARWVEITGIFGPRLE